MGFAAAGDIEGGGCLLVARPVAPRPAAARASPTPATTVPESLKAGEVGNGYGKPEREMSGVEAGLSISLGSGRGSRVSFFIFTSIVYSQLQ